MTSIEWTDATWNPVTGCTKVSPGCAHCYAETIYERFHGKGSFETVTLHPERLPLPLTWRKPRRIFVNSMSDLFHEDVPFEFIDRVFAVMALAPQHTFQVLTKRPERMREYMNAKINVAPGVTESRASRNVHDLYVRSEQADTYRLRNGVDTFPFPSWPLPNVWLGTSTENQHWLDIRVPELLATPAAVRFLSCEPLLGPLDLHGFCGCDINPGAHIDWIIVGGESGPKARPMDVGWARSIVEQCRAAGVAVFYKQGGKSNRCLHSTKGGCFECIPANLQIREFPNVR